MSDDDFDFDRFVPGDLVEIRSYPSDGSIPSSPDDGEWPPDPKIGMVVRIDTDDPDLPWGLMTIDERGDPVEDLDVSSWDEDEFFAQAFSWYTDWQVRSAHYCVKDYVILEDTLLDRR